MTDDISAFRHSQPKSPSPTCGNRAAVRRKPSILPASTRKDAAYGVTLGRKWQPTPPDSKHRTMAQEWKSAKAPLRPLDPWGRLRV